MKGGDFLNFIIFCFSWECIMKNEKNVATINEWSDGKRETKFYLLFYFYRFTRFLNLTTRIPANKEKQMCFILSQYFNSKWKESQFVQKDGKLLKSNWRPNKRIEVGTFQCNCNNGGYIILKHISAPLTFDIVSRFHENYNKYE